MTFYHLNSNSPGERLAQQLEQLEDYRVLRRLPRPEELWCRSMPVPDRALTIGVVDCETTGLDPDRHKMIEFAIGKLKIDLDSGDLVDVTPPQSWLEDPAEDLPIEIERLTHITSDMLIGTCFRHDEIRQAMRGVDVLLAHNAKFDRAFVTRRFPSFAKLPWVCSMSEVDWAALGWGGGRSIGSLLTGAGFFLPDAHRASADVWATICLLASTTGDGQSIAAALVDKARRTSYRLYADRAPFACKDVLKVAGYRWAAERRMWWIEGDLERIANEKTWLIGLAASIRPRVEAITWMNRHQC